MKYAVTLKQLRDASACFYGYNKVVCMLKGIKYEPKEYYMRFAHNEPISLIDIANNNGFNDAIWCLQITNDARDNRLFAVWCARQVQHLMEDERSVNALDVVERFANGEATEQELDAVWAAAWTAASAAASAAAWTAAWAASAAAWTAAWTAADAASAAAADAAAARAAQKEMFIKMCNGEALWQIRCGDCYSRHPEPIQMTVHNARIQGQAESGEAACSASPGMKS